MVKTYLLVIKFCLLACLSASPAMGVSVINGDLNGVVGISSTPTSWNVSTESPDLTAPGGITDSGFIYANGAPASPNGGTFVIVETSTAAVEGFSQFITGLAPGQEYQVSFFQSQVALTTTANPSSAIFTDPARWDVNFAGTNQLSPLETFTGLGTQTWTPVQLSGFIAGSSNETLSFTSVLPGGSTQAYLGIDGIAIQAVPEPASVALLLLGATCCIRRRFRKTQTL